MKHKLIHLLKRIPYFNRWLVLLCDLILATFSTTCTVALVCHLHNLPFFTIAWKYLILSFFCNLAGFLLLHTYKGVIRHSTFGETGRIALAVSLKTALVFLVILLLDWQLLQKDYVHIAIFVDAFFTFTLLVIMRSFIYYIYHYIIKSIAGSNGGLLIYEQKSHFIAPSQSFLKERVGDADVIGFLKYGKEMTMRISGFPLFSFDSEESFARLCRRYSVRSVLFIERSQLLGEKNRLVKYCSKMKIRMLIYPSALTEMENGSLKFRYFPEVRIDDILGRDEIQINMKEISESLKDKVVMVTGAAGSIGGELCRQLCSFGVKSLVLFDSAETPMHLIRLELEEHFPQIQVLPIIGDVRMVDRVDNIFRRYRPQIVFHAAAYKHVPLMEENPCEAVHTNVYGTYVVANTSVKYEVEKFIEISTDKAVNPTNVMGASKRLAEMYVQSLSLAIQKGAVRGKTRFITTRFGNVLGSNGSVIPRFREQLAKGGPLTVTHPDIIRYFMTIPEACRLVLEASFMGKGNEVFVFDMGEPVKIADMARRMIELSGLTPDKDIQIKYTGLRPGEKLFEELLVNKAEVLSTSNGRIFRAKVIEFDYNDITTVIKRLMEKAIEVNKVETVRMMKLIVPEFKSQNSEYEKIDQELDEMKASNKNEE